MDPLEAKWFKHVASSLRGPFFEVLLCTPDSVCVVSSCTTS